MTPSILGRYRIMQNNEQDTFTVEHIDKNHTSLNAFPTLGDRFKLFADNIESTFLSPTASDNSDSLIFSFILNNCICIPPSREFHHSAVLLFLDS